MQPIFLEYNPQNGRFVIVQAHATIHSIPNYSDYKRVIEAERADLSFLVRFSRIIVIQNTLNGKNYTLQEVQKALQNAQNDVRVFLAD